MLSLLLGSGGTGDNLDQLAGNDGLASAVEQNLELVDHLAGVLGGVVHGVATGGLLAGVALGESPEEGVGQGVLAEAGEDGLVDLEGGEVGWVLMLVLVANFTFQDISIQHTRLLDGLLGEGFNDGGLVAGGVDELVVQDLDAVVLGVQEAELVGDGGRVGESGDGLADTREVEDHVLGVAPAHLGLALLAEHGNVDVAGQLAVGEGAADVTRHTRVDTTTETLVGGAHDQEGLLALAFGGDGAGLLEGLLRGLSVDDGLVHGLLGAGELGGGDDLHGLGDLLDVADGLEAALDLTESGIVGGLCDERGGDGRGAMCWRLVAGLGGIDSNSNGARAEWQRKEFRSDIPRGGGASPEGGTSSSGQHGEECLVDEGRGYRMRNALATAVTMLKSRFAGEGLAWPVPSDLRAIPRHACT